MTENQSTEIAIAENPNAAIVATQSEFTREQQDILKAVGCAAQTKAQWDLFLAVCQRTRLDPFAKQIYMVNYGGSPTIQTGIDGYRVIAQRAAEEQGISYRKTAPQWCGPDGQWVDVWLDDKPPAAARVGVALGDDPLEYSICLYREYVQRTKGGDVNSQWRQRPAHMLAKCAEALALRTNFPNDMAGVYIREEMSTQAPQTVVTQVVAEPAKTAGYYMRVLRISGKEFKALAERVLGRDPGSWEKLPEDDQQAVLDTLAQWEAMGCDPTTGEVVDSELVDEPAPDDPEVA